MNAPTLLAASAALAAAVSLGVGLALLPTSTAPTVAEAPDALDALVGTVERIAADQRTLARRLDALEESAPGAARLPVGEIERLVREALAAHGAAPAAEPEAAAPGAVDELSVDDLVARLSDSNGSDLDVDALWREVREAGRMDEVLAAFEARATARPDDPEVQLELGQAYLAKIQEVGNGPLAGAFAQKADGAFDRALATDPQHWNARFHKAVALSFWPPVFGKQGEAVHQFEILARQQSGTRAEPHHAETHLLLGNLYQQLGQADKALAAWQLGASLFPSHEGLHKQLQLAQGDE